MRENMLLQYADDIIKVEIGSLRGEMLRLVQVKVKTLFSLIKRSQWLTVHPLARFVAQYGGSCGVAVESAGRRMVLQLESRLRESLERLRLKDQASAGASRNPAGNSNNLEATLQQLLAAMQAQSSRMAKLETSCSNGISLNPKMGAQFAEVGGTGTLEQEVTSREVVLEKTLAALKEARVALGQVLSSTDLRFLPAGDTFISPPTIYSSVFTYRFAFL